MMTRARTAGRKAELEHRAEAALRATVIGLRSASDRLNPMLVKELRQGMRRWTFACVFLSLQVLMLTSTLFAVPTVVKNNDSREVISFLFWVPTVIMLLVAMPLRGLSAMTDEVKNRTFELLLVTRLSAWRIASGKWLSLVVQTWILVVGLLPFLALRYFGGADLIRELDALLVLAMASSTLLALAVFASTYSSLLVRGGSALAGCLPMFALPELVRSWREPEILLSDPALILIPVLSVCSLLVYYFLTLAAARVAPAADLYALRKRLLALALMAVVGLMVPFTSAGLDRLVFSLGGLLIAGLVVDSTYESRPEWRCTLRPPLFAHLGLIGRAMSRLIEPTWQSGCLFALCAVLLYSFMFGRLIVHDAAQASLFCAASASVILVPAALARLFRTPSRLAPTWFVGFQVLNIFGTMLTALLIEHNPENKSVLELFPDMQIAFSVADAVDAHLFGTGFAVSSVLSAGSILLLLAAHRAEIARGKLPQKGRDASRIAT
jgi:hypothetical protein